LISSLASNDVNLIVRVNLVSEAASSHLLPKTRRFFSGDRHASLIGKSSFHFMLKHASEVSGYAVHASDGLVGTVSDLLFEETTWLIRWLVVSTGDWTGGRVVLLPPLVLAHVNHIGHQLNVNLTRQQVRDCPDVESDRPVSRQTEANLCNYYGWTPYWGDSVNMDFVRTKGLGKPLMIAPSSIGFLEAEKEADSAWRTKGDSTVHSINEVLSYHIEASDGEIGHVEDFLVEAFAWSVRYLLVSTKNWWPGKKVLISRSIQEIRWDDQMVCLGVSRQKVKDSPAYDPSMAVDSEYERNFHRHYSHS
jgi:hypothetical protein